AVEPLVARLAVIEVARNPAVRIGQQRALDRHGAIVAALRIVLVVVHQRPGRLVVGAPGDRGADAVALRPYVLGLGVGAVADARPAKAQDAALVDPAAEIEGPADRAEAASGDADLAEPVQGRQLARQRDDAARAALAVEDGGWAFDHVDAVEERQIDLRHG